jgi:hypothetical protein
VIVRAVETLTVGVKLESARFAGVAGIVSRRRPVAPERNSEEAVGSSEPFNVDVAPVSTTAPGAG